MCRVGSVSTDAGSTVLCRLGSLSTDAGSAVLCVELDL